MNEQKPKHIICAVHGRPESKNTIIRAVELALEYKARLTFYYVVNIEFLGQATPTMSPIKVVYKQMEEMGKFTMMILCDRARRRGIKDVDYVIRRGNAPEELRKMAIETDADIMVIGRPVRGSGRNVFSQKEFDQFVMELQKTIKLQIVEVVDD
jgi:nucleotide-binding universal stress UspA family protein